MEAARARLRGIRGIDQDDFYASPERFVVDKLPELVESPGVMEPTLGLPQTLIRALSNTLQVFKDDGLVALLGRLYDMLADLMVNLFLVTTFLARKPGEDSSRVLARRLRAFICLRLQRLTSFMPFQSVSIQRLTTKRSPIRKRSYILDAQVNTQRAGRLIGLRRSLLDLDIDVILFALLHQYRTGRFLAAKSVALVVSYFKGNFFPAGQQGKAYAPVFFVESEDNFIVVDTGRLEDGVSRLSLAELGRYSTDSTNGQIGRQAKLRAHVIITAFVEVILTAYLVLSTPVCHMVAGIRKRFHSCFDMERLIVGYV